jgi:hypothetical protein
MKQQKTSQEEDRRAKEICRKRARERFFADGTSDSAVQQRG